MDSLSHAYVTWQEHTVTLQFVWKFLVSTFCESKMVSEIPRFVRFSNIKQLRDSVFRKALHKNTSGGLLLFISILILNDNFRKPDVLVATIQTRATRGKDSKTLSDLQRMKIISRYYFAVHPTLSHLLQKNWYNFKIKSKRELCKFISNMNHAGKKLDKLISKTYLENCSNTSAFL